VLLLSALAVFVALYRRDELKRQWRSAGKCAHCGYDLRASEKNCPECNTPIPPHTPLPSENDQATTRAFPCIICGATFRAGAFGGNCPRCGHEVRVSALDNVAAELEVDVQQVKFIRVALTQAFQRRQSHVAEASSHLTARDTCLAVRDHAIEIFQSPSRAHRFLRDLGITGSDQIGKVIWTMVDHKLLVTSHEDKPEQFRGLFTLDQLMQAVSESPSSRDEA